MIGIKAIVTAIEAITASNGLTIVLSNSMSKLASLPAGRTNTPIPQINIIKDPQNGNAPPPGPPVCQFQPIGNKIAWLIIYNASATNPPATMRSKLIFIHLLNVGPALGRTIYFCFALFCLL